jgi:RNA polymerase sigma-70 factor, ECF subfamily
MVLSESVKITQVDQRDSNRAMRMNRTSSIKDRDILEQLKTYQPGAFKLLVDLYQEKVLNTCFRFLANRQDAEDVTQEVFIQVYQSICQFQENAKISTWIYRIAVSKSLDAIRKKNRKKRFVQIQRLFGQDKEHEAYKVRDNNDPGKEFDDAERLAILHHMISSLSENQQIAITLNKFEGLSQKEIAEIMGTTVSAVDALITRAKKNLHKKLYEYYKKII